MIEKPELISDVQGLGTVDWLKFHDALSRTLVLCNAGGAVEYVKMEPTTVAPAATAGDYDLAIEAGATMMIPNISVQTITVPTGSVLAVWRFV